jgi:hypothetical protein
MDTRTLEQGSKLVAATSWGAILSGVFIALALQTVLLLFGLAIATSVGDHVASNGYDVWAVFVSIVSFAIGGALAGSVARADNRASGIAAGFLMWAVALVVGNVLTGFVGTGRVSPWTLLFGALLALGAAIVGGMLGASLRGTRHIRIDTPSTIPPLPPIP